MTTLSEIHPIACQLFNQDGKPWLYVSDEPDQQLTLEVSNASGRAMEWKPIFGEVSENNHHLVLKFRQGVLLHGTYDLKLSEVSAREWEATCSADGQLLYLIRIADDLSFPPDRAYEISLEYIAANTGRGSFSTKVGLTTRRLAYAHSPTVEMRVSRTMYLGIAEEASVPNDTSSLKHASLLLNLTLGDEYQEGLAMTLADNPNIEIIDAIEKKYEHLLRISYVAMTGDSDYFLRFHRNRLSPDKSSKIYLSFHQQKITDEQPNRNVSVRAPDGWEIASFEGDDLRKPGWVFIPEDTVELNVVGYDEDISAQRIEIPIQYLAEKEKGYFTVFYENVPGHFDGQQLLAIDLENNPPKKAIPILPYVHFQEPTLESEPDHNVPSDIEDEQSKSTELVVGQDQPETPEKAKEIQWTGELTGNLSLQAKIETNVTLTFRKSAPSGFKVKTSGDWTIVVPAEASSARMQVYKKEEQAWKLHQQLAAPKGTWGGGAALHGEWLAVTAHDAKGIGKIVFYQLQNDQWTETQSLSASKHNNWFGEQVALFEARAIVGAQMGGNLNTTTGQATTYDLVGDAWIVGELLSPTSKDFGKSVALNNNWALVGSQSLQGFQQENGQWQKKQQIVNEDQEKDRRFSTLDASGNQLVAGAMADDGKSKQAFLFQEQNGQWQQMQQLQLPNDLDQPGLMGGMNAIGQD